MIMLLLGRLARTGDKTAWEGWSFEVVDLDNKRIDKVLASRLPEESTPRLEDQSVTANTKEAG
jgi:putative hemolysin